MFFIFGMGNHAKSWEVVVDGVVRQLVCEYTYISLFFVLKLNIRKKWILKGNGYSKDEEISNREAKELIKNL
jgi:hypothetical protein